MKILVTGGNGFIGKEVVKVLSGCMLGDEQEHEIRTVGRTEIEYSHPFSNFKVEDHHASYNPYTKHYVVDLSREALVRRMFAHWQPDVIIHLAANPNSKPDMFAPTAILDDNIKATQNLLHWCAEGTHFLFASSIVVYGNAAVWKYELSSKPGTFEEPCTEECVCEPTSMYGITKLASEHLIKAYADYRNIKYKILRICATVGPNLNRGILRDFIRKVKEEEVLEVLGDEPGSCKPYIHVNDVANAFALLMYEKRDAILNICSRWSLTVKEVAEFVMEEMGVQKKIVWAGENANWKGDNRILSANPDKATHFGWDRQMDSEEAIRRSVRENLNI
jgi:UDP-glucose 4-epimerase